MASSTMSAGSQVYWEDVDDVSVRDAAISATITLASVFPDMYTDAKVAAARISALESIATTPDPCFSSKAKMVRFKKDWSNKVNGSSPDAALFFDLNADRIFSWFLDHEQLFT
jgi:hypothetical protein